MNTALEIKEDGQIWLIPECPVEPNAEKYGVDARNYTDRKKSQYYRMAFKKYDKALASAERILVSNQEVARELLFLKHCIFPKEIALKEVAGIYPIPDLQWEVIDNTYIHEGSGKYWEDEPVKMKRLLNLPEEYAVISLPESLPEATIDEFLQWYYGAPKPTGTMECEYDNLVNLLTSFKERVLESKEDNKASGEWISVDERLPEHLDRVLVALDDNSHILMASFQIRLGIGPQFLPFFADGRQPTDRTVTHWMPLPSPPRKPE